MSASKDWGSLQNFVVSTTSFGLFSFFSPNILEVIMRIIIYSLNYSPEIIGIGKYNTDLVSWLTGQGHEIQVICAPPYYPSWIVQKGYSAWRYLSDQDSNSSVLRCPIWIPKTPSGLKRILHLLSFAISSWPIVFWYSLTWKPDIIFTLEPPLFCLPGALFISKLFNCKVWLHIQDFELDAGFNLGLVPNSKILQNIAFACERWLLQKTAIVSTISEEMLKLLQRKGVPIKQSVMFPNWVNTKEIQPLDRISFFRAELGLRSDQTVCLYSGNLGNKQGLEILIDAARHLQHQSNIVFVIAGEGPTRQNLVEQARDLQTVQFLELQPRERFNELLNLADIHMLPQSEEASDLVFPSKLKAMFASGRPVIATAHSGTQLAQVVIGRGLVIPPGNAVHLSKAIRFLHQDRELRCSFGNAARGYAIDHWGQNPILSRIEQHFIQLAKLTTPASKRILTRQSKSER
jgi:colanic acid biosynthesis glycosyl transferase WcaI